MKNILVPILSMVPLSGCASTIAAITTDPIQNYSVRHNENERSTATVYTLTGERRTAIAFAVGSDGQVKDRFCTESLPDAASAANASSDVPIALGAIVKGSLGESEGTAKETFSTSLEQTFIRTEISDVYRQMGWNTCLAWAQGAIDKEQYHALLREMVTGGLKVLEMSAKSKSVEPSEAKPDTAKPANPKPVETKAEQSK